MASLLIARFSALEGAQGPSESGAAAAALPRFHGVVFYGRDGWQVMDRRGHVQAKATSPIREHEAFVVFDEARCRCVRVPDFCMIGWSCLKFQTRPWAPGLLRAQRSLAAASSHHLCATHLSLPLQFGTISPFSSSLRLAQGRTAHTASPPHGWLASSATCLPLCRGADMKLLRNAEAALTLGPRTPRDKLMQAAGRLRQLDKEQKLVLLGTDEVCRLVAGCCRVSERDVAVAHVVEWVHQNTATQNSEVRASPSA